MRQKFRGRLTDRDNKIAINAALDFYNVPKEMRNLIPPKRHKVRRPVELTVATEAAVNDGIYEAYHKRQDVRLWRNNRGVAQYGSRMVTYGVGPRGASDWIGYRVITVTQDMLGKRIAQFAALEAKRPGEKPDDMQQKFIESVLLDGGIAGWADSAEKAKEVLP